MIVVTIGAELLAVAGSCAAFRACPAARGGREDVAGSAATGATPSEEDTAGVAWVVAATRLRACRRRACAFLRRRGSARPPEPADRDAPTTWSGVVAGACVTAAGAIAGAVVAGPATAAGVVVVVATGAPVRVAVGAVETDVGVETRVRVVGIAAAVSAADEESA
ncbi:MAG TPA: hypothetical protein VNY27_08280 [Solirubrobacteraceae bacterium]|nr:hypothetical protein [Solirubrobacteraceae bacterium]